MRRTTQNVLLLTAHEGHGLAAGDTVEATVTRSPLIPAWQNCSEAIYAARPNVYVSLGVEGFDWKVA
jgi:hypothetical protein